MYDKVSVKDLRMRQCINMLKTIIKAFVNIPKEIIVVQGGNLHLDAMSRSGLSLWNTRFLVF